MQQRRIAVASSAAIALWSTLLGPGLAAAAPRTAVSLHDFRPGSGLSRTRFQVTRSIEARVQGTGAGGQKGSLYAYGWIIDCDRLTKVWSMVDAEPASGIKTRRTLVYDEPLRLAPGCYQMYFYAGWRHETPGKLDLRDLFIPQKEAPGSWRLSILVEPRDAPAIQLLGSEPAPEPGTIRLSPLGHNMVLRRRFHVQRPVTADVMALGEAYANGRELSDRSWLLQLETRAIAWQMDAAGSVEAGGVRKNRMVRAQLALAPGNYELVAVTDDSHAHGDWNAFPPLAPDAWGVQLRMPADALEGDRVPQENTIVRLGGAYDDERLVGRIRITRPLDVRIYCLGEWDSGSGDLVDRGWIQRADNRAVVWRMRYEDSIHGGGATKNRAVDTSIQLPPGEYDVFYETDDTHSVQEWNSLPPFDPQGWGLTLSTFADGGFELLDLKVAALDR